MQYIFKGHLGLKALDDCVIIIDCDAKHTVSICDGRWRPVKVEMSGSLNFLEALDNGH